MRSSRYAQDRPGILHRFLCSDVRSSCNWVSQVLTEATGAKILFDDAKDGEDLVATGVEFIHGGKTYKAYANKEVVLAGG